MTTKYVGQLAPTQRRQLRALIAAGRDPARALTHARILLKADQQQTDTTMAQAVEISVPTVQRVCRR